MGQSSIMNIATFSISLTRIYLIMGSDIQVMIASWFSFNLSFEKCLIATYSGINELHLAEHTRTGEGELIVGTKIFIINVRMSD